MVILEVKNLTKIYKTALALPDVKRPREFTAVSNVSFALQEGEILGILGPNGAGKTTTIQMLLGVLTPTRGSIHYFGKDLKTHREEILEKINFSSTYTNLPWDLTIKENLVFISYLYNIADRKKRIEKIIDVFRLESILNQPMKELSAGQLTRVNIAKAFINYPRVLLLDEPTASLDPEVASYMRELLLRERKLFKVSIIITSHDMGEVEEMCDRVIFINKGRVIADDTPYNLARTIKNARIDLMVRDGRQRLEEYLKSKNILFQIEGNYIKSDINERDIGRFLKTLAELGIVYEEISIEKPTLKDYFLQKIRL